MTFNWDPAKDRRNREKHGISFEQAQQAFFDPFRIICRIGRTVLMSRGSSASALSRAGTGPRVRTSTLENDDGQ
jgi:hypothetical protein